MKIPVPLFAVLAFAAGLGPRDAFATERPLVFPLPQKMELAPDTFPLAEGLAVLVPERPTESDLQLARFLVADLSDRHQLALRVQSASAPPAEGPFIIIGSIANPLVRDVCRRMGIEIGTAAESYRLVVTSQMVLIAGADDAGAFYGLQSLRQLVTAEGGNVRIRAARIEDHPHLPFRAIRLYLPGPENIGFFKRFLRDFMALYKFNKVIVEVNASMRLHRHPELNAGWLELARNLHYTQRYYPLGPNDTPQNSAHHDAADGRIVEQDQVADLVRFARQLHIEVIPEIPTLTHSYYLLTRHRQFAAVKDAEWPDTYCPGDPDVHRLVFDVLDEYIAVMRPRMVHIGHDELFIPLELCRCCGGTTAQELFAQDVRTLHEYLTAQGVKVGMYGDHLIESVRGVDRRPARSRSGWAYHTAGALSPAQVREWIPKDILIFNWFWQDVRAHEGNGEPNDLKLIDFGFEQAYMNFTQWIENWGRRSVREGVIGGAPAAWVASTEYSFGKDMLVTFLGTANLLWSSHWPETSALPGIVQSMVPEIRRNLSGTNPPSKEGNPIAAVDLPLHASQAEFGLDLSALPSGPIGAADRRFTLSPHRAAIAATAAGHDDPRPRVSGPIPIGADVSSIVFLHASARPAANDMSYRYIHNFPDTADLLGWYEVVYEDGFTASIPVRYGVNVLHLGWGREPGLLARGYAIGQAYAYEADVVECGPHTFFAHEWVNPRYGKTVREVRLRGTTGFLDTKGKPTPANAIILAGLNVVTKPHVGAVVDTVD